MKASSISEQALAWRCEGATLVGVLAGPAEAAGGADASTAVLIVVGGPQVRTGSHRQFTLLARALAAAGWTSLRFDVRGMGDSEGEPRSFEALDEDLASALQALREARPSVRRVVVVGLCDAASAALLLLDRRPATREVVAGLVLINPWVRTAQTQAATQVRHYYTARLRDPAFWKKLLRGGVAIGAVGELLRSLRALLGGRRGDAGTTGDAGPESLHYVERMARAWCRFGGPIRLVLSGQDYTAREFEAAVAGHPAWQGAMGIAGVERVDQPAADHTLSAGTESHTFEQGVVEWLARHFADAPGRVSTDMRA
jgi:exosortase A-associated hydrolase 1